MPKINFMQLSREDATQGSTEGRNPELVFVAHIEKVFAGLIL